MTYENNNGGNVSETETPSIEETMSGTMASGGMADELPGYAEWIAEHAVEQTADDVEREYAWWLNRERELGKVG